ncbi:hypothetical protein [Lactobacillus mulieris]|uniref:Bacteriocin-associated integral membrane protein n=1 Tax=Lactobacillus mulieris TaxID=2508708 RepID=A0AAW5WWD2_9LACO|nr:hypothetical protein [Lactobacillus mulieris]MCZ3621996.1 hypothetical protein [Lactobacillus mulieris]MCZ3623693.1 hypothetical protein [Lactobacillus mulieris]MCZ3636003.1 hypothetical protein [Lactobacillus mulieris]MCZ3689733.1 hypothetical protein [Lactobacillus mulieris]MCZ3695736.1 hypothetical protein [Lactobacillus mulieris]
MFKKSLKFIFILLNMIVASLFLIYSINQYSDTHNLKQFDISADYTPFQLPEPASTTHDYLHQLAVIKKTSQKMQIHFLKRSYFTGYNSGSKFNYNTFKQNVLFESDNLSNSLLSNYFGHHFQSGKVYSTAAKSNSLRLKSYGTIAFTIKEFNYQHAPQSREGIFFIQTTNPNQIEQYLELLSQNYNHEFASNYSVKDFLAPEMYPASIDLNLDSSNLRTLTQVAILFQLIFFMIYFLTFNYENGVYSLLGYSLFQKVNQLILKSLIWGNLPILLLRIFYEISKQYYDLILNSCSVLFGLVTLEYLLALAITFILGKLPTNRFLVKRADNKYLFGFAFLAKVVLVFLVFISAQDLADFAGQNIKTAFSQQTNFYHKYVSFYPLVQGYNETLDKIKEGKYQTKNLYPTLNRAGAIYIDTSSLNSENPYLLQNVDVNVNYLKLVPVKKLNGKKVILSDQDTNKTILLPQRNLQNTDKIAEFYSSKRHEKVKFIIIKNQQALFNEKGQKINNYQYITVRPLKNVLQKLDLNIFTGASADTLKIPLIKNPLATYRHYEKLLAKYNSCDNLPHLIKASDSDLEEVKSQAASFYLSGFDLFLSLVTLITVTLSTINLYFSIFGREFAIKQALGRPLREKTYFYWALILLQTSLLLGLIIATKMLNLSNLVLFAILTIGDILFSTIAIKSFSKNLVRRFLND